MHAYAKYKNAIVVFIFAENVFQRSTLGCAKQALAKDAFASQTHR